MQKFPLCADCLSRFDKSPRVFFAPQGADCHICRGLLSKTPELVAQALASARDGGFEWETFSVSSSFPKIILMREQEVADFFAPSECTSLKNKINAELSAAVEGASKKKNSPKNPDAIFEFDFIKGIGRAKPATIYVHGHYNKLSRQHCQSRWHCSSCNGRGCPDCKGSGMNYPSVEEEIGKVLVRAFSATEGILHASGREDVDVRALGGGRPFIMELRNPKKRHVDFSSLESEFAANPAVRAKGLKLVRKEFIDTVCGSHFEKEYSALVGADRPLTSADAKKIETLSGQVLFQQTPTRVMHRRADMVRKRKVISLRAEPAADGKLRLVILAEAGTYIKELISSDGGRTKPSVAEMLSCKALCEQLDVTAIHDFFLETIRID